MTEILEKNMINMLLSINLKDIPDGLTKDTYIARCIKCYDGDSPTFVIVKNNIPEIIRTRLYGIDTPEMKGANRCNAIKSRNALISLLTDANILIDYEYSKAELEEIFLNNKKLCIIETIGLREKYGRLLCNIYDYKNDDDNKKSFTEYLIKNDFGKPYFGGTKDFS